MGTIFGKGLIAIVMIWWWHDDIGKNDNDDTDSNDHLVENNGEGDNMMIWCWYDGLDGVDHLVENNGEGVANASTGAMEHKRKGLVVTEKKVEKKPKMIQKCSIIFNSETSIPYLQSVLLIL